MPCPTPVKKKVVRIKDYNDRAEPREETQIGHYNLHFSAGPTHTHTNKK